MSPVDRAGPVSEISPHLKILCKIFDVFIWEGGLARFPRSRQAGWKFCHMNTSSRLPGWTAGWILVVRMASSFIACCILHIISIPFNCSDTALRVTDGKIGPKVKIFVFRYVCFVSQIWRQNSYPGSLTFSHLGNRAEISHMNQTRNSSR